MNNSQTEQSTLLLSLIFRVSVLSLQTVIESLELGGGEGCCELRATRPRTYFDYR